VSLFKVSDFRVFGDNVNQKVHYSRERRISNKYASGTKLQSSIKKTAWAWRLLVLFYMVPRNPQPRPESYKTCLLDGSRDRRPECCLTAAEYENSKGEYD